MPIIEPRILSGFMELLPEDQLEFNKMFDTIRSVYEQFGFTPIETPAIELAEVLLAKGGGETEQQIYRFNKGGRDLALHFDLTVPLARYVAQHEGELIFPFRRYQMQKVWRGERAGAGRFREFYQCDIDVIGSDNVLIDAEIPSVIYEVFCRLGFERFVIKINNRKILNGFLEFIGVKDEAISVLRIIDKIDKIGRDGVETELLAAGLSEDSILQLFDLIDITGSVEQVISALINQDVASELFKEGVDDLKMVSDAILQLGVPESNFRIDLTVARGLDYYTGTVYETLLDDFPQVGSVCSGGRFDDLASYYTTSRLPGVGISIGLTRLFYILKEAGYIKSGARTPSKVLILPTDIDVLDRVLEVAAMLRRNNVNTEINFDTGKLSKQMSYANRLQVPYVVVIGANEVESGLLSIKDMNSGVQKSLSVEEVVMMLNSGGHPTKEQPSE